MSVAVPIISIAIALVQIILCINSIGTRENLCADDKIDFLNILDASGNAGRSNIPAYTIFSTLTTSIPYVVLYFIPVVRIATRSEINSTLRDGIITWLALLCSTVLRTLIHEPRPGAYALCVSSSSRYGMPSERAVWAVALYVYASLRGEDSWLGSTYGSGMLLRIPRSVWGILLWCVAIPFTRYELQYNTPLQIVVGVCIGAVIGWLGSKMVNPRLILTRFQVFLLYFIVSGFLENIFWSNKKILAFSIESFICVGAFLTWRKNNQQNAYKSVKMDEERDFGILDTTEETNIDLKSNGAKNMGIAF